MAAYSASLRGASRIFIVDRVKARLELAERHVRGCVGVDFGSVGDAVEEVIALNGGEGVERSVDCVGYQASGKGDGGEVPNGVLEQCIRVTRATGGVGVPGLYVPSDPGAVDEEVWCFPFLENAFCLKAAAEATRWDDDLLIIVRCGHRAARA